MPTVCRVQSHGIIRIGAANQPVIRDGRNMGNSGLQNASKAKRDEFYTSYVAVRREMMRHSGAFSGKSVYCNCDNPHTSNFFRFFVRNFTVLGLKRLTTTSCVNPAYPPGPANSACMSVVEYVNKGMISDDGIIDMDRLFSHPRNSLQPLSGDGDFRSSECVAALDGCDIVATNPPFSLFREFVDLLKSHGKDFIIIGDINAVSYRNVFPDLMRGDMWLDPSIRNEDLRFFVPDDYPLRASACGVDDMGRRFIRVGGVRWFTSLDVSTLTSPLPLKKSFADMPYPRYDNYDAINVNHVRDIPCDYPGIIGVPVTFMDKYCPSQFEILGISKTWFAPAAKSYGKGSGIPDGSPVIRVSEPPSGRTCYRLDGKYYVCTYVRIFIRNRTLAAGESLSAR